MDPNACVNLINSTEDADELTEHVSNLLGWLQRGGFKPSVELEVVGHTNPSINFKLKRLVQLLGRAA